MPEAGGDLFGDCAVFDPITPEYADGFSVCFGSPGWCGAACRVRREKADRHSGE